MLLKVMEDQTPLLPLEELENQSQLLPPEKLEDANPTTAAVNPVVGPNLAGNLSSDES